jgi:hypothetical protein
MNISRTILSNDLYTLQIVSSFFWEANIVRVFHSVITKFHLWLIKNGNYRSHPSSSLAANRGLRSQELKQDGTITSRWVSELHSHFFLMHVLNLITWKCRSGFSDFFQGNKITWVLPKTSLQTQNQMKDEN